MPQFEEGDSVRVDIPDEDDPDFHRHRQTGIVVNIIEDDVGSVTGDVRDEALYFVELDADGEEICLRWRDLRPINSENN